MPPFRRPRRRRRCSSLCMTHPGPYDGGRRSEQRSVACYAPAGELRAPERRGDSGSVVFSHTAWVGEDEPAAGSLVAGRPLHLAATTALGDPSPLRRLWWQPVCDGESASCKSRGGLRHPVVPELLPPPTHRQLCVIKHQRSQRFLLPPFRYPRRRHRCSSMCMIHPGLYDGGLRTGRPSVTCWSRDGGGTRPREMGASSGEDLVYIPPVEGFGLRRQLQHAGDAVCSIQHTFRIGMLRSLMVCYFRHSPTRYQLAS